MNEREKNQFNTFIESINSVLKYNLEIMNTQKIKIKKVEEFQELDRQSRLYFAAIFLIESAQQLINDDF